MKLKSCGSLGCASFTTTSWPLLSFVKVQVTVSPADTPMLPGELPSSQVALCCTHPAVACSVTE